MTNAAPAAVVEAAYEPFDPRFREDPERHYARLRETEPVYRSPAGYWVVTAFKDVQGIYQRPEAWSSSLVGREALAQGDGRTVLEAEADDPIDVSALAATPNMVSTDPPRHTELRRVVNRAFLPKRLKQWDGFIEESTVELIAGIPEDSSWEVNRTLAMPLPVRVISRILGIEGDHSADIKRWSDILITSAQGNRRHTADAQTNVHAMLREFSRFFVPMIEERRVNPRDDMISDLVGAQQSETLSPLDTLTFIKSLMVAGNETTTSLIGNTIVLLLDHPEELAKVQSDPSLLKNAIEESLRYRSPVQFNVRSPVNSHSLGGKAIEPGEAVILAIGAANRDPDHFPDPDSFDVTRKNAITHLAFGYGIHSCLGVHLARREAFEALSRIVPQLHKWKLASPRPERVESNLVYGYKAVWLEPR